MKSYVAAGLAALFLVGGAVWYLIFVSNTSKNLADKVDRIEEAVKSGDFDGAKNISAELDKMLEEKKTMLCAIVDHKEIYEIKRSISELNAFLEEADSAECLSRCGEIDSIVSRISENTMPYVSNIL